MNDYQFTCQDCKTSVTVESTDMEDAREQAAANHRVWDDCDGDLV